MYFQGNVVNPKVNLSKSVEAVKASLEVLPDGFRIVQAQNCHKINVHPKDNLLPPYKEGAACKNGTHFSGLWWENGVADLAADNAGFLQAYKAAGGKDIDAIVLDPELSMSEWAAGMLCAATDPCCIAKLDAIQADTRFPPLLAELQALGFTVDKSKPHWLHSALVPWTQCGIDGKAPDPCPTGYTDNVAIYNGWSYGRSSAQYDAAVLVPAQKVYPTIDVNNYGDFTSNETYCLPDQSGYTPCKIKGGAQPTVTGTQQAPCMYVWMENASVAMGLERVKQLPAGSSFDLTGWNGLLMGINLMRMTVLSSSVPVVPWVAYKNDTNMSPFQWVKPMANTDYYQEHILHLAMHNPPSFLYFNPCWAVGYCDVTWEDNLLFANMFHELTEMVGCAPSSRTWVKAEFAGWGDKAVATGMVMPDGTTVWRVTTFDGKTAEYTKSTADGVTVAVPGSPTKLVFKGGKSKGAGPNGPFGVWIETPKGSPPPGSSWP